MINLIIAETWSTLRQYILKTAYSNNLSKLSNLEIIPHIEARKSPKEICVELDALAYTYNQDKNIIIGCLTDSAVNRVGHLIMAGYLDHEEVTVKIIYSIDNIQECGGYTEDGHLESPWPLGFFLPERVKKYEDFCVY